MALALHAQKIKHSAAREIMTKASIELSCANKSFQGRKVLEDITMRLNQGEITTLVGPNGAGKSTLLKVILGLIKLDSGVLKKSSDLRVGYMPQKIMISPVLPLTTLRFLQLGEPSVKKCIESLKLLEIEHITEVPVIALSGGEMQRALLARAILGNPNFLFLDEPVQGVDANGQIDLYKTINSISRRLGCGVLMVSHDLHIVMSSTDHVICLNQHICCSGQPEKVSKDPAYINIFGDITAPYAHKHDHQHTLTGDIVKTNSHNLKDSSSD